MAIRMTYITYTPEAHRAIIEGKQNREPVMRALIEDAGGKFIGFYGLIGRPEGDGVVISDFADISDYMSVVAKTMLSGAISDITTAHCYTGEDVVAASDAFFPFVDGIEKLAQSGVTAVIQPSGSIRDKEIIKFANETETILVFSRTRHFRH